MSADVNLRAFIVDTLKPLLPKRWVWFNYSTGLDALTKPTVMLTLSRVSRMPEAPSSHRNVEYTLSLIDPSGNPEQREDSLDDSLVDLLNAIDSVQNLSWTGAERGVLSNSTYLGYDITITFPINKTAPTPEA